MSRPLALAPALALVACLAGPGFAAPSDPATAIPPAATQPAPTNSPIPLVPQSEAGAPSLLRIGAALLAVVALLLGVQAILKRTALARGAGDLRIETRLPVAKGGHVAVVRVDGRRLLVGITASTINLISELGDGGEDPVPPPPRFDRLLAGILKRGGAAR